MKSNNIQLPDDFIKLEEWKFLKEYVAFTNIFSAQKKGYFSTIKKAIQGTLRPAYTIAI